MQLSLYETLKCSGKEKVPVHLILSGPSLIIFSLGLTLSMSPWYHSPKVSFVSVVAHSPSLLHSLGALGKKKEKQKQRS